MGFTGRQPGAKDNTQYKKCLCSHTYQQFWPSSLYLHLLVPSSRSPTYVTFSPQVILVKGKLDDRNFMKKQIKCMLSNDINDCDETGRKAKILGPQILSKRCPARVCDKCTKHAVNMVV